MVFAAASGNFSFIIFLIVMIVGFAKMGSVIKNNDVLKGAAKKGLFSLIGGIFRK
jgi:hypothetical protein